MDSDIDKILELASKLSPNELDKLKETLASVANYDGIMIAGPNGGRNKEADKEVANKGNQP